MSLPSTKAARNKQLNPTSLQQQQLEAQFQASLLRAQKVSQAAKSAKSRFESADQPGARDSANPISTVLAGGAAGGPSSQFGNGGSDGAGGAMGPGSQSSLYTDVSLLPSQIKNNRLGSLNDRRGDLKSATPSKKPRNREQLGTYNGPATSAVKSHSKNGAKQKGEFRDKLFKVVEMFFGMANKFSGFLPEEMIDKNIKLKGNIDIITGKKNKEIDNISIDEMASAFEDFQECYTNVKGHLLANDYINSTESLKTSVDITCAQIGTDIFGMSNHDIMQYQKIKQHFQSKVEEYKSLGITLPTEEVEEINRYEYTSGANLTAFKTLVDDKINKLKDQYVEKVKDKRCEDVAGYLEANIVLKELKAELDSVRTQSLEEINRVIEKQEAYIDSLRIRGKLNGDLELDKTVIEGLPEIDRKFSPQNWERAF